MHAGVRDKIDYVGMADNVGFTCGQTHAREQRTPAQYFEHR